MRIGAPHSTTRFVGATLVVALVMALISLTQHCIGSVGATWPVAPAKTNIASCHRPFVSLISVSCFVYADSVNPAGIVHISVECQGIPVQTGDG